MFNNYDQTSDELVYCCMCDKQVARSEVQTIDIGGCDAEFYCPECYEEATSGTGVQCSECASTNAYTDWELWEGVALCPTCAMAKAQSIPVPTGWEIDD